MCFCPQDLQLAFPSAHKFLFLAFVKASNSGAEPGTEGRAGLRDRPGSQRALDRVSVLLHDAGREL
jgi:hypothetical protein